MSTPHYDVFLSHHSADKPAVEELARRLVRTGLVPWLDTWNLIPGAPWQEAIEAALAACASCAIFVGPSGTGPWQNEEMRVAIDRRVSTSHGSFRVIPVLFPGAARGERSKLPSFLTTTTWVEFRDTLDDEQAFHRLVSGIRGVEPGPGPGRAVYEGVSPYRGLQVFDVDDWPFFFGREALVEWLLDALRPPTGTKAENRFLGIIGPSGSGKSSLARAGLVAAFKRGKIRGSEQWPIVVCKPGADPLESLAVALCAVTGDGQNVAAARGLIRDLREDPRTLHLATRLALRDVPPERRLVVLVDQFEEVFTLCHDDGLRQAMIDTLLHAATVVGGQTIVLVTLRADFYGKCATYPTLAAALSDHQMLVGPMTRDELRSVIARPAAVAGCAFEPGLMDELVEHVQGRPGALPLLEYTLLELWRARSPNGMMKWAAFRALGGVEGALACRADSILDEHYTPSQRDELRTILLRLVQPGEGTADTRRRMLLSDLVPAGGAVEAVQALLKPLADERLLTTGCDVATSQETVEISHEALIHAWPTFGKWISDARDDLRLQIQLEEAAKEWQSSDGNPDFLWSGLRLGRAKEWLARTQSRLNERDRWFLDASQKAEQARAEAEEATRREREALLEARAMAAAQAQEAAEKESQARAAAESQARAGEALFDLSRGNAERALLLARAAVPLNTQRYSPLVSRALRRAFEDTVRCRRLNGHTDRVEAVAWSPDGRHVLTGGADKTARIWEAATGKLVQVVKGHVSEILAVAWSPDGRHVLTASADHTACIWDVTDGILDQMLHGHKDRVRAVAWSPDGRHVLTGSADHTARIWDVATGKLVQTLEGDVNQIRAVAWSPDARYVLTGSADKTIRIWDLEASKVVHALHGHTDRVRTVAWSPDGRHALTGSADKTAYIWDVATGKPVQVLKGHTAAVWAVAWSPDSLHVLTGSDDRTVRIWDVATGKLVQVLKGHTAAVRAATWSPDGQHVLTGSVSKIAHIWKVATGTPVQVLEGHTDWVRAVAWSPDGRHVLTGSADHTARIWDLATGTSMHVLEGHIGRISGVAWNPDGRLVLTGGADKTARIWDVGTGALMSVLHGHTGWVRAAAWRPDGKQVLTGSADKTARIWDLATSTTVQVLEGHTDQVSAVGWSPDGRRILTGSDDYTAHLWIVDQHLIVAEITRRVCNLFSDDEIRAEIPAWHGCAAELAAVADDLKAYDALRSGK